MLHDHDRPEDAALAVLRWTGELSIAAELCAAGADERATVARAHWIQVATYRPKSIAGGLLQHFVLRAISVWAREHGAAVERGAVLVSLCAPVGCICLRCSMRAFHAAGYPQAAQAVHVAKTMEARAVILRGAHPRLVQMKREAVVPSEVERIGRAIAAVERIAIAHGVNLEERPS